MIQVAQRHRQGSCSAGSASPATICQVDNTDGTTRRLLTVAEVAHELRATRGDGVPLDPTRQPAKRPVRQHGSRSREAAGRPARPERAAVSGRDLGSLRVLCSRYNRSCGARLGNACDGRRLWLLSVSRGTGESTLTQATRGHARTPRGGRLSRRLNPGLNPDNLPPAVR
jgi:hypothetical protein